MTKRAAEQITLRRIAQAIRSFDTDSISAAAIQQAKLLLLDTIGCGFAGVLWQHVDGRPVHNAWRRSKQVPARTDASDAMSRELKRLGFKFVGSTICYAFMQASGMVNDHLVECFRHNQVRALAARDDKAKRARRRGA